MDAHPFAMPAWSDVAPTGIVMSSAEFAVLVRDLQNLRDAHRTELAQRLHDVRARGATSDDDDRLAVLEETAIDRARIAQLEELVNCGRQVASLGLRKADRSPGSKARDDAAGSGRLCRFAGNS